MPVWAMVITDVLLTAAAIGVFMLFDYVMPQSSGIKGEVVATADSSAEGSFTLPNSTDSSQAETPPHLRRTASLLLPPLRKLRPLPLPCVPNRPAAGTGAIRIPQTTVQTRTP